MKLGTETGSIINHVQACSPQREPVVGDGATILQWSDRLPGTIVKVTKSQVHVREDHAVRIDGRGMSDCQKWAYSPDPAGLVHVFRMTKRGYRNKCGNGLLIGHREKYHDFSF